MVRETRHLWVGNLPDNIREDRIREHFKRYGRVQNVKLLGRTDNVTTAVVAGGTSGICATVAFMDIKSASKAHNAEHVLDERTLTTEYYEPAAIPSATGAPSAGSSPAGSGYSGSSSSVNSTPAPASVSRYHLSGGEDSSSNTCPIAASAAAPATWRGTNDSATDYCRRGNTPAAYGRYQRNNSTAPYSTPPSNVERTTPHHRWYAGDRISGATGGESTPSTPGGGTEGGRPRRHSGSGSSRSDSSSPEPSDTSRASTPATQPLSHHNNHRTPPTLPHQWASTASGRPLAICVRNLPTRSTDSSLKDGLYHEYKKHGKVVWVKVVGQNADRYAVVRFKKPSDVEKALEVSQDKLFFGCKISVAPHQSCDEDADSAKPYETDIDEYHPKATRTLFIGNLEKDVTQQQLRDKFKHFGRIIEIDIKKGSSGGAGYAFCQYASISSVVEAIRAMDGEYVGGSRVKLGFGKPVATTCVWVDGLTEHTEKQVLSAVSRCGGATSVCVDRAAGAALVHFEQAAAAGAAVRELRRVAAAVSASDPDHPRLCVDYASRECQEAFYEQLEKHGGTASLTGSERLTGETATRYMPSGRHESARYDTCSSRSRASSYGRSSSRTPRYSTLDHYDPTDYAADRRYRVYDEVGSSPPPEDVAYEDRLQSVVVSPHRARRHRRDSSPEDRKHSKERHRSVGARRSRSGSRGGERHVQRRKHRRRCDGSGSHSRAGTPLRDELDALPTEPRRAPRERPPLPMSLPLPKFAVQLLRTVPPAPRPAPAPAPDSPPRPPSISSSSEGSAPHSPSLEERIRSLDEKLNGSRNLTDAPDRTRLRHRLLEIDINEVKPSEVVRSLLAKRSVFDEDSERLEGAVRVPSPNSSPLASSQPCTPRALRYPFPAHPPPPPTTPPDEPRVCPRTPDTGDREQCDVSPDFEFEINDKLFGRPVADSFCGPLESVMPLATDVKNKNVCINEETASREQDVNSLNMLINLKTSIESIDSKSTANNATFVKDEVFKSNDQCIDPLTLHVEDNSARDVMDMLLRRVEIYHELQKNEFNSQFDKKYKCTKDHAIRTEFTKQEDRFKLDSENNFDLSSQIDSQKNKNIHENNIAKELLEYELQKNHKNSTVKSNLEISKDLLNNTEQIIKVNCHSTKLDKENIQIDKISIKEKFTLPMDKKTADFDKTHDERAKMERDKMRQSKEKTDKHEHEREKLRSKFEKYTDKEKKIKEDIDKTQTDKIDKMKIEKETEKYSKDKPEKDVEKLRHLEEKPLKHDHHKKDKNEKDKKLETLELDSVSNKLKKDDKHKHEKPKKDNDAKKETKRESESIKHRKSSRDESLKELCRKDSTDSSTSRTSHESSKVKDTDSNNKEETKLKHRHSNMFQKHDNDKESLTTSVKTSSKDEKEAATIVKNKSDNVQEQNYKFKGDITEKQRHYSLDSPSTDMKRKERLSSCSSLPSNIGHKRRMSSQDSLDSFNDDAKKCRNEAKISERRDSKDNRSENRHKTTKFSKGHFAKLIESKTKDDKKNQVKPPDDSYIDCLENEQSDSKDLKNNDKTKLLKKSPKEEVEEKYNIDTSSEALRNDLDFLATLELRSSEEDERQRALRKEMKEKKRIQQLQQIQELQMQQDALQQAEFMGKIKDDKKQKCDDKKKEAREKRMSSDRRSRDEKIDNIKRRNRKLVHSSDSSDSDEPKKHSIFDIVDDGPTYISMYDKVKARSCKNMQKQEEEKRQEKIKAKFSQLKQSRAKREEKKRSSWDEDSDSDPDRKKHQKSSMDNSSDDDIMHATKRDKMHVLDYEHSKMEEYFDGSTNDEDLRNKLSRKNSRSRIMSDSSDDEISKRSSSKSPNFFDDLKKDLLLDSETMQRLKSNAIKDVENNTKNNSLLSLFGKGDSDESKVKLSLSNDNNGCKATFVKALSNEFSSENESLSNKTIENCRKHKKRQRKHKSTYSDEDIKIENSDTGLLDGYHKLKSDKHQRHSNKKEKRKNRLHDSIDSDDTRDEKNRFKKEKKLANNSFEISSENIVGTNKKEGKMEDIFGPLSDESDKETLENVTQKTEYPLHDIESIFSTNNSEYILRDNKDENKRKREKKRREKRYLKEDDNSLDVDAVSKAIEARLFADTLDDHNCRLNVETISGALNKIDNNELKLIGDTMISEIPKHDKLKKECKEKKKKKKKSREDRQNRKEHHSYHQEEKTEKTNPHDDHVTDNVVESPRAILLDIPLPSDELAMSHNDKVDDNKLNHSLPRLTDSPPTVIQSVANTDLKGIDSSNINIVDDKISYVDSKEIEIEEIPMPPPYQTIVTTDISEVPLPKEPLPSKLNHSREDFLANLGSDGDLCEDAVRNITNSEKDIENPEKVTDNDVSSCKMEKKTDEKPRAIISQEETEDAVAALLGESFGGKTNDFSNYEDSENDSTGQIQIESTAIENESIPEEDAEEMRQAVQNLNASEMEIKPDTPVSDNDLLLIDTDTEEADETTQDALEKLPINIIATNQALNRASEQNKSVSVSSTVVAQTKSSSLVTQNVNSVTNESMIKETKKEGHDVKIHLAKRESPVQVFTSSATPVITSWTINNQKLLENPVVNIESKYVTNREKDIKPTHITANIQTKPPQAQNLDANNLTRPLSMTSTRMNASYQVINQMIRPQISNVQPPTVKIPETHILYQKPQSIVISPRMSNDPRLQSPKAIPQNEGITSPRLTNVAILSSSPQNLNSVGIVSPNAVQQRSPGQMKVVRMQQPPLSPIQAIQMPHGTRTMLSPNRPNSVLVQGTPIHFNRLPVTPVLAPISKQINVTNLIQQNKTIGVSTSTISHQQKNLLADCKNEPRTLLENPAGNSKIVLSAANLQPNINPTTMAQNRLMSMQNAMHVANINSPVQLNNKVLINNVSQSSDKKDNQAQRSEQISSVSFGSTPIIHMSAVSSATTSIIQSGMKTATCNLPDMSVKINRSQSSNVIQSLNSQRILNQVSLNNIIVSETNKVPVSNVFSMTTIRPSFIAKLQLSTSPTIATTSISNMSSMLSSSSTPIRISTKFDTADIMEPQTSVLLQNHVLDSESLDSKLKEKIDLKKLVVKVPDEKEKKDTEPQQPTVLNIAKCETDFEELLKDNTNEIKILNDPEKKLEVNVGKNVILNTATTNEIQESNILDCIKTETKRGVDSLNSQTSFYSVKEEKDKQSGQSCQDEQIQSSLDNVHIESGSKTDDIFIDADTSSKVTINNPMEIESVLKLDSVDNSDCNVTLSTKVSEAHDPQLKNDEGDSWSAKDVNIESVIKKVDSLCNENVEVNMHFDEINKQLPDNEKNEVKTIEKTFASTPYVEQATVNVHTETDIESVVEECTVDKFVPNVNIKRGGRNVRGKKSDKNVDRVQTRQISKPPRGTASSKRGRGRAKVDKKIKALVNNSASAMPGDVYDFHEDSGDETATSSSKTEARPRLILTIKSPLSGHTNMIATSTLSINTKDHPKLDKNKEERHEEFISPSPNTRKSRRLQEKDVQRNTIDDVIEDVIKGPAKVAKESNKKRPIRQAGVKVNQEKVSALDTRKSPRGVKRIRDRSLSDASIDSGDEKLSRETIREPKTPRLEESVAREPGISSPLRSAPLSQVLPSAPTPITKPPKKMISEISAKLACAFETAAAAGVVERIQTQTENTRKLGEPPVPPVLAVQGGGEAAILRRLGDSVPGALVPVGATEATDARVQSPALPHRPPSVPSTPSMHRAADRATPLLIRGVRARSPAAAAAAAHEDGAPPVAGRGEGEAAHGAGAAAGPAAVRQFRAYAATASLPRGAHHPQHPPIEHQLPKQVAVVGSQQQHHHHPGAASRVTIASVPSISPQGQMAMGDGIYPHFSHQHYQMYQQHFRATQHESRATQSPYTRSLEAEGSEAPTPALELRRPPPGARVPTRGAHSPAPDLLYRGGEPETTDAYRRNTEGVVRRAPVAVYALNCGRSPPPAHSAVRLSGALPPGAAPGPPIGPPHASQVPREADSLQMLLRRYPVMWQGLLALKNDSAAVQMHFVGGNPGVAGDTLSRHADGITPLLRIAQRMRLEPVQLDQVHRKMKMENEHCMLLALPCGRDHMDVLQQSNNLTAGFITYLQRKQAAGIVNVAPPGHHQAMFTVHIFPSCDFANENLNRIAPDLMHRVADIAHLLIVIATV